MGFSEDGGWGERGEEVVGGGGVSRADGEVEGGGAVGGDG